MPNQRQRRARRVVKGMAAEDPAPQSKRFSMKNTTNTTLGVEGREEGGGERGGRKEEEGRECKMRESCAFNIQNTKAYPGTKKDVISTLLFQRRPPITERKEGYEAVIMAPLQVYSTRNTGLTLV